MILKVSSNSSLEDINKNLKLFQVLSKKIFKFFLNNKNGSVTIYFMLMLLRLEKSLVPKKIATNKTQLYFLILAMAKQFL